MVDQTPVASSVAAWLLRTAWNIVVPPLPRRARHAIATLTMFWLGVIFPGAITFEKLNIYLTVAGVATCVLALASLRSAGRTAKVVRLLAHGAIAGLLMVWAGGAVILGGLLAWSISGWGLALIYAMAMLALVTAIPGWRGIRVPVAIAVNLWIALCMVGWPREDGVLRCDDFLQAAGQPGVDIVVPVTPEARGCAPGDTLNVGRYPRRVWEAPGGERFVVTTQAAVTLQGVGSLKPGRAVDAQLTGLVCEVWADRAKPPRCFQDAPAHTGDEGPQRTAEAIIESEPLDRLFVAGYIQHEYTATAGLVSEFTRSEPLTLLAQHPMQYTVSEGYYDPRSDVLGLFDRECKQVDLMRASRLGAVADPAPLPAGLGESHYDSVRGEGVICLANGPVALVGNPAFLAAAFRGFPFSYRALGASSTPLLWASFGLGCDFDPKARRVYVGVATTGLLATIDYDSGEVLRWSFVGFGIRSMVLDRLRHRLYGVSFPDGHLTAIDTDTGRPVGRWFVGRFPRGVSLSRDGRSVLVASSFGVVRVRPAAHDLSHATS